MGKKGKLLCILAVLAAVCAGATALRAVRTREARTARIYQDGRLVREIRLDALESPLELTLTAPEGGTNLVRAEPGRICILAADCPDKLCVNQGWMETGTVPIVCLPHRVVIELVEGESDAAAVSR